MPKTVNQKGIDLPDWQITAIAEGRCTRVTIPIEPQPRFLGEADVWDTGEAYLKPAEMRTHLPRWCPFQPGDVLYCRERYWLANHGNTHRGTLITYESDGYSATLDYVPAGRGKLCCWREADTMPEWAARTRLRLTAVSAYRLSEITHRQCVAEGWPGASELLDPKDTDSHYSGATKGLWIETMGAGDDACIEWFADQWEARHPGYPWETAWGWALEIERSE